jgi:hypothetical protein
VAKGQGSGPGSAVRGMESALHRVLKAVSVRVIGEMGYALHADEVRTPIARFRADVAGVYVEHGRPKSAVIVECKASRNDFLRDATNLTTLLRQRTQTRDLADRIEREFIRVIEPDLCRQASLFDDCPELADWEYSSSRLTSYALVQKALRRLEARIHGSTRFFTFGRYQLATRLFIAVPRGLVRPAELPIGWGLIEADVSSDVLPASGGEINQAAFEERLHAVADRTFAEVTFPAPVLSPSERQLRRLYRNVVAARRRASAKTEHIEPPLAAVLEDAGLSLLWA